MDPNLPSNQSHDYHILETRFDPNQGIAKLEKELGNDITSDDIATTFPVYYSFFPTDEVLQKLILKCTKLKTISDLWHGFEQYTLRNGETRYAPVELIYKSIDLENKDILS